VGVDGWNNLCNRQPNYDGVEFIETEDSCTAIIYRKDRSHPTKITEYLSECVGNTSTWRQWPRRMLRHKAFIQAARMAFGFAGIYDEDEARRIVEAQTIEAETAEPPKSAKSGLRSALGITDEQTPAPTPKKAPEAAPDAPEAIPEEMYSDDLPL
jgi:type IV secretory pathway VirB10-like protein